MNSFIILANWDTPPEAEDKALLFVLQLLFGMGVVLAMTWRRCWQQGSHSVRWVVGLVLCVMSGWALLFLGLACYVFLPTAWAFLWFFAISLLLGVMVRGAVNPRLPANEVFSPTFTEPECSPNPGDASASRVPPRAPEETTFRRAERL
jgi:hypothetical protein